MYPRQSKSANSATKGLYAKAHAGVLKEFAGVSDLYEPPKKPELSLDTGSPGVEEEAERVLAVVKSAGFFG